MSGSIKTHKYSAGNGQTYYYRADESNLENIITPGGAYDQAYDFTPADNGVVVNKLPKGKRSGIKPRQARFVDDTGNVSRYIIIPSEAMYEDLLNGVAVNVQQSFDEVIEGVTYTLRLAKLFCEIINIPMAADTGLDGGDAT